MWDSSENRGQSIAMKWLGLTFQQIKSQMNSVYHHSWKEIKASDPHIWQAKSISFHFMAFSPDKNNPERLNLSSEYLPNNYSFNDILLVTKCLSLPVMVVNGHDSNVKLLMSVWFCGDQQAEYIANRHRHRGLIPSGTTHAKKKKCIPSGTFSGGNGLKIC